MATSTAPPHPDPVASSPQLADETKAAMPNSPAQRRRKALLYCLLLLSLPLLGIVAGIALGRSDFFLNHGASVWVRSNDAVFAMRDRRCDVVVFGDSTAMTGIDPEMVEQQTGLAICNIAVTNAVMAVTGNRTLDHFLAHNVRPRILLLQLSPDDLQQKNHVWQNTIYAEGILELLRHGSAGEARHLLLSHPQEALAFAGYAAGYTAYYGLKQMWFHLTGIRAGKDAVVVRNGFFTPPAPPRSHCDTTVPLTDTTGGAFSRGLVEEFRRQYAGRADRVLVNVSPIPVCDGNLSSFAAQLRGVTDNPLLPLPIGLFNDQRHYTRRGATTVSHLVADQLTQVAAKVAAAGQTTPSARPGR